MKKYHTTASEQDMYRDNSQTKRVKYVPESLQSYGNTGHRIIRRRIK